eukprot:Phypoly_transcript_08991.p1 GENE.Phypoly_transcript_08991~~Phypoly_transcript_08991.p1  ORF type:complete len:432 (+),score=83.01 Phypoly_transcript_08991:128-1423(+)
MTGNEGNVMFVTASAEDMNNNNLQDPSMSPYTFRFLSSDAVYTRPTPPGKGDTVCDLCFKHFSTFSSLYNHKAKLCYEDLSGELITPIKICFAPSHLRWIGDTIKALKMEVKESDSGYSYVVVDESMVEMTMRRFYVSQITKYNLEEWYPAVEQLAAKMTVAQGFTPKTVFMTLSDDELKMIRGLCSVVLANNVGMNTRETQKELTLREQLEDNINSTVFKIPKTYFCKLSTRSPKDSVSTKVNEGDEGTALLQKMQAKMDSLKVENAEQVINLITRSQRIFSDISMYFQYRVPGSSSGEMSLIFREWMEMPQDREFRCFATNRTIHAISQYHCYTVFPSLQSEADVMRIRAAILAFHDTMRDALPMPDYVMDVVVYADGTCQMIEVNPFGAYMSSGAALFNWKADKKVMYGEESPPGSLPVIRVLKQLVK